MRHGPSTRRVNAVDRQMAAPETATSKYELRPSSRRQSIALCKQWLRRNAQILALTRRWATVEASLAASHNWFQLTEEERKNLSQALELSRIDSRLDVLFKERDELSKVLPRVTAKSHKAIAAKAAVLAALIDPDDHPAAHALIVSAVNDLELLQAKAARLSSPARNSIRKSGH